MKTRVIPVLLLDSGGLVKTTRFKSPSYVGDPINAVKIFCGKEVDELALLDITATRRGGGPDFAVLNEIVTEAFMPVAYGGGIASIQHAEQLFEIGIEKVVINSALADNPGLVNELAKRYGSQAVVVSIDVADGVFRGRQVCVQNGTRSLKRNPVEFALEMQDRGAGEMLLTSIAREGTLQGYDCAMIKDVAQALDVPVVAHGGAGSLQHMVEAVDAGASAVAAGAMFVYHGPHRAVLVSYPDRRTLETHLP